MIFAPLPDRDEAAPTSAVIATALAGRSGEWAIVAICDRQARADALVGRISSGKEYGAGYSAVVRKVGGQIRVYARRDR